MTRISTLRTSLLAGVLLIGLTACNTVPKASTAATVNGVSISKDSFEGFINEFSQIGQLNMPEGIAAGDDVRSILTAIIKENDYKVFLQSVGKPVTAAQKKKVAEGIADEKFKTLTPELQNLIINLNAETAAVQELGAPSDADIKKMYEKNHSLTGVMCVSHIVMKEKSTATKVLAELNKGGDFAKLAAKYSTEAAAKKSGGRISGNDPKGVASRCMSLLDYQANFDPLFTAGAIAAKAGTPYGPVQSSFGYHIILVAPFAEVAKDVVSFVKSAPGPLLATGHVTNSPISVDPAYGRWNPATASIAAK